MKITISHAGRRFNYEWVLKNINYTFQTGNSYAILGPNGSGKSTLLQMIAGILSPSAGSIRYENDRAAIDSDDIFRHISMSAPYLELLEELTMPELLQFQQQFKPFLKDVSADDVINISQLGNGLTKHVRHYSSGMKQRLKLALAVLADVPVVLLDEPTTNLDESGVSWYLDLIKNYGGNRLIIVCSNTAREYSFCSTTIDVLDFK